MFLRHNRELVGEVVVPDVLHVIQDRDKIVHNGIAFDLRVVTNLKGPPREE